ncbi:hypothetical protein ACFQI7_00185 [Paenibacillus allorhizosphaerae]|uniref:Amidase n=1 Tax=Paenibacillus allorhizosphaerae TaxID=2849866 RepID=A0ABM8VSX7_9BACL|nr:hypothetical protein [Paenibacillus allorhizosphaerae]CAG7656948.1 hypothetical protein PAECIP111802_06571 [Paenibacillus allorhizosphaerae]
MAWAKNNYWGHREWLGIVIVTLVLFSGTFIAAWTAFAAPLPSGKSKATWVWDTSLIATSTGRNQIFQFAKNQQISRIYLQVNPDVAKSAYRSMIKTAAGNGIEVYVLDGAPNWALPENRARIASLISWVKTYNASVATNERFAGIQLDVEPYLLPEWSSDQSGTAQKWLDALSYFHDETKKAPVLSTSAAIPFWLDSVPLSSGVALGEVLIAKLDEVALMSYRDQGDAVADLVKEELAWGDKYGKKVWLSLETNPVSETPYITFYEEGKAEMDRQMARIDELVKVHPSYAGIAVHDYIGWRNLKN